MRLDSLKLQCLWVVALGDSKAMAMALAMVME
jgi:hypothetical protein